MSVPMIVIGLLVMFNFKTTILSIPLMLFAFIEAVEILTNRIYHWIVRGGQLYLTELMVKKFSMLGCTLILMLNDPSIRSTIDRARDAFYGLIVDNDEDSDQTTVAASTPSISSENNNNSHNVNNSNGKTSNSKIKAKFNKFMHTLLKSKSSKTQRISNKMSVLLLVSRILIAGLFIFVGFGEIKRQLAGGIVHKDHIHKRPPGDGHDQLWLKVVEFTIALPFLFGLKTTLVSLLLGVSLVLESVIYWRYWSGTALGLGVPYMLHARDHFYTNFGVAGGLFLLQYIGPGKYSVDELLVKKNK